MSDDVLRRMAKSIPSEEGADSRQRLFDLLDEAHKFQVPKSMIDREFGQIWRHLNDCRNAGELDADDVGKSDQELMAEYRAIAERRVRLGFVLKEIARRSHIKVAREDVAFARASGYRGPTSAILEDKVVEFIFGLAR